MTPNERLLFIAKVGETSMKLAVKQEKLNQYPQKARSTASHMVSKIRKVTQGHYDEMTTEAIKFTKRKNVTLEKSYTVNTTTHDDLSSTWEYYHDWSHPHFNLPPPHYSRAKLVGMESPYIYQPSLVAKVFHSFTPRVDLFFQHVDNKPSLSSEYLYVSI